jgi:TonB family protein
MFIVSGQWRNFPRQCRSSERAPALAFRSFMASRLAPEGLKIVARVRRFTQEVKMKVTAAAFLFLLTAGAWTLAAQEDVRPADPFPWKYRGVTRPVKISGAPPAYPEAARKSGAQGIVVLEALIDEQGNVRVAKVSQSLDPDLDQAALEALRAWKFKPATYEHHPVKVFYTLTVKFSNEGLWKKS